MSMSRLTYLLGDENLSYPSEEYLDYVTPVDVFSIVLFNANVQLGGLSDKVVWDMFAGIGTDSIRLARYSGRVISTEINPITFNCLSKNLAGLQNIEIHNKDCRDMTTETEPDVIYFDPPWGDEFKTGQQFSLDDVLLNNGLSVLDIFNTVRSRYPEASVIIKTPFMCDFEKYIPEDSIKNILTFSRQKLKYILLIGSNDDNDHRP
jgi:16S rRNA G966 N2-methylase RsmD